MATLAHSYTIDRPAFHRPKPRSVEQIAIDRIGARQLALADCVAAFLDTAYEGEWQWEASDNFFGTPVDSAVITGTTPNGDGTHSGIIMVGDMDILGPLLRSLGMDRQRPKSFAETLFEHIHWLDPFWGPLQLPYHLLQWIEENDMPLNEKDWEGINKVLDQKFEQHKPTIENISFTGKQMLVLAGSIVSAAILIGGSIIGGTLFLNNSLNNMASRIEVLDTKIDERLPSKLPEVVTSTNTHSSKLPTTKDDPVKP